MSWITAPFAWLLKALYELTGSYGWAVILFGVVVNLILLPFMAKSKKSMMRTSRLQPRSSLKVLRQCVAVLPGEVIPPEGKPGNVPLLHIHMNLKGSTPLHPPLLPNAASR